MLNDWSIRKTAIVENCGVCNKKFNDHYKFIMHLSYENRKELVKLRAKEWAKNNPEKRKKIIKQNNDRSYWRKKRWLENKDFSGNKHITEKDICSICNSKEKLGIHHVDGNNGFKSKPINNSSDNLVILCWRCHPKVHNRWWLKDWREVYVESMAY